MDFLAAVSGAARAASGLFQTENTGLTINLFWVIVAAANFIVFLLVIWLIFFKPVSHLLEDRHARIEQGLRDADAARRERENAATDRLTVIAQARQEAEVIVVRAQSVANDSLERELEQARTQIEQMKARAAADLAAERQRAVADVRRQVAELALAVAGRVVGETMNDARERRLVEEFLSEVGTAAAGGTDGHSSTAKAN